MIQVTRANVHPGRSHGPFQIRRIFPGIGTGQSDRGLFGLGAVDRALLQPGLTVPMHEHRDDEIVSYLRTGQMLHVDSSDERQLVSPGRLMVMNAGSGFFHEETIPGSDVVNMLQIFIRPRSAALKPAVQFVDLSEPAKHDDWRLLVAPDDAGSHAPATVRQSVWFYDARVAAGASVLVPTRPDHLTWVLVFAGSVTLADQSLADNDSCLIRDEPRSLSLKAHVATDVVAFVIDPAAPFTRSGTISGA
jgi:quercetin 2,3-dioxygenase